MPVRRKSKVKKSRFNRGAKVLIAIIFIVIVSVVVNQMLSSNSPTRILLVTSMGNITLELYGDMPITSGNFENLTRNGILDGTLFHRVAHNFVIQGGDASINGIHVPTIPDELPNKHSNIRGSVAMAKTIAPNSATSQFYINLKDNLILDDNYSVFGKVIEGMDVVDAIGSVPTNESEAPLQDVIIIRAEFVE